MEAETTKTIEAFPVKEKFPMWYRLILSPGYLIWFAIWGFCHCINGSEIKLVYKRKQD